MNYKKSYSCLTRNAVLCTALSILFSSQCLPWGSGAHQFINRESVKYLPPSLTFFINNVKFLGDHASDADTRKGADPTEAPKHYIDIDAYPEYFLGTLPHDFNAMILRYGSAKVYDEGILPWATLWAMDSLVATLKRSDTLKALQFAADLGHYVGDGHQPLHVTSNYDGGLTGNNGIHSRYESSMMNAYLSTVQLVPRQAPMIDNVLEFTFSYLTYAQQCADSIIRADNAAKSASGGTYNSTYYSKLWTETGPMTIREIDAAARDLASLIYTASVKAGIFPNTSVDISNTLATQFSLGQNYPNPFNSTTSIQFILTEKKPVQLTIYNTLGTEIATLAHGEYSAGVHHVRWIADDLASGVYYYRLTTGDQSVVKRMILLR